MKLVTIAAAATVALAVLIVPAATASADPVHYDNCQAVRDAGKAPLHKTDPGYRKGLDRDGDGLACEAGDPASNSPAGATATATSSSAHGTATGTATKSSATSFSPTHRSAPLRPSRSYDQIGTNRVPRGSVATGG